MKKMLKKCIAASLIMTMTLSLATPAYAFDDDLWDDLDASPAASGHESSPAAAHKADPFADLFSEQAPAKSHGPHHESAGDHPALEGGELAEDAATSEEADPFADEWGDHAETAAAETVVTLTFEEKMAAIPRRENIVRSFRYEREVESEYQNAVLEGLQITAEPGAAEDEMIVTGYFIFRDRPTSFFYDIERKKKKEVKQRPAKETKEKASGAQWESTEMGVDSGTDDQEAAGTHWDDDAEHAETTEDDPEAEETHSNGAGTYSNGAEPHSNGISNGVETEETASAAHHDTEGLWDDDMETAETASAETGTAETAASVTETAAVSVTTSADGNLLIFEFLDAVVGANPITAPEYAPMSDILVEEMLVDANSAIRGLNPEWHDMVRVTISLDKMPMISVSNEGNVISFSYKWTIDPEKIPMYLEPERSAKVFWISAGALAAIGVGVLTYFLLPKKDGSGSGNRLGSEDLPNRPSK